MQLLFPLGPYVCIVKNTARQSILSLSLIIIDASDLKILSEHGQHPSNERMACSFW